jgi:predicted amidohydrolase
MDALSLAIVQTDLVWENPAKNRERIFKKFETINSIVDLIILPEMFTSGFTMNPFQVAEHMDGETVIWLKNIAYNYNTTITGSLVIKEQGNFYNRLLFVHPDGHIDHYDKKHLFTLAGENEVYSAGTKKQIVTYKGWKICPLICYDLRFPVWARNEEDYDLLLYVANWPKPRIDAWDTLLKARAIENMCYCVGVNRIGLDNNNYEYTGNSAVYDYLGKKISSLLPNEDTIDIVKVNKHPLLETRKKLQFLNDRDSFTIY